MPASDPPRPAPPGPDRDRQLASRPRYAPRAAAPLSGLVAQVMRSEEIQRARRFERVLSVLRQELQPHVLAKITPLRFAAGVLTLQVADGTLASELRQYRSQALLSALAQAGSGVSRIVWRLAPGPAPGARRR